MSEPIKPRIDFAGPLDAEITPSFKTAHTFSDAQAEKFAPVAVEALAEEGPAEAVVEAALHPKRSLWRKMVSAGLALFGVSVIGQGVQWTMNAADTGLGGVRWVRRRCADYRGRRRFGRQRVAAFVASAPAGAGTG